MTMVPAAGAWSFIHRSVSGEAKPTAEGITAALNLAVERVIREAPHNWFWVHNRWKTPKPEFLLSNYRRGMTSAAGYDVTRLQALQRAGPLAELAGRCLHGLSRGACLKRGAAGSAPHRLMPGKLADLWQSLGIIDDVVTKEGKEGLFSVARTHAGARPV